MSENICRANPCLKTKTTDRVFQFHGGQCGSRDKADDTTKTNAADLWGNSTVQIHKALSFKCQFDKRRVQKGNFNIEN